MQIPSFQLKAYSRQKTEALIREGKCFLLIQLYDPTPIEIEAWRPKISPLGLRLIRFPLINWKKTPALYFRTASHLPLHNSNYALLGNNKLSSEGIVKLNKLLEGERVIFIFGYNDTLWLDPQRLWNPELAGSSWARLLESLQSYLQTLPTKFLLFQQLLRSLESFSQKLK